MGAPAINSLPNALALTGFMVAAFLVTPRLHNALIYQNYPLK
jgi:hypothetical protein